MGFVLDLPRETEQKLRDQAARAGQRPEELALHLVESGLTIPSLDDDLAQLRKAILKSGETETDTAGFFQSLVDEARVRL